MLNGIKIMILKKITLIIILSNITFLWGCDPIIKTRPQIKFSKSSELINKKAIVFLPDSYFVTDIQAVSDGKNYRIYCPNGNRSINEGNPAEMSKLAFEFEPAYYKLKIVYYSVKNSVMTYALDSIELNMDLKPDHIYQAIDQGDSHKFLPVLFDITNNITPERAKWLQEYMKLKPIICTP